ncbi:VWA domain-containing protein [Accumulibacter sp.]|uniref:VWA domain-containing protein n=1 Tax=Accumulibacter sp. TaxID=2053492 RepID=UPI0026080499|nr:VWA domain-containing protein [Accumulibacter sp.]
MGYGSYSFSAHQALTVDRAALSREQVFRQSGCHPLMNPRGLTVREARDSAEHPDSLAIVFALDVTGSMGHIPELLARQELPTFMKLLTDCRIRDPQVLFMAIGDATSDHAPLQVGQFETTAELIDQWLTWSCLEGGGGGSNTESYELAFYVLAQHTDLDCWVKRGKRGYLFMTGDELPYPAVSRHQIEALIGERLDEDLALADVIAAAAETYRLFFLIPDRQRAQRCEARWREVLGDHVICMESHLDTCAVAAAIVGLSEGALSGVDAVADILHAGGSSRERIAATVRALQPYADLLDPEAVRRPQSPPAASRRGRPDWWQRLFS